MSQFEPSPPKLADRLLKWYCSEAYFEEVQGDLHEWFYQRLETQGLKKARRMYYLDVIRYFRSFRLKRRYRIGQNSNLQHMKQLFKVTFRNLARDRFSALLRIGNLALGIMVFLLTLTYARYELNYDRFPDDHERLYRLGQHTNGNPWAASPMGMGAFALDNFPEIEKMTRLLPVQGDWIKRGDEVFRENHGFVTDSTFFDVFTCKSLYGNLKNALTERPNIVVTESMALKYFDRTDVVGEALELADDDGNKRLITAVIEDFPKQSHLKIDFLIPLATFSEKYGRAWRNFGTYTYVKLREGADQQPMLERLSEEYETRYRAPKGQNLIGAVITPVKDIHLKTNHEKEIADNGNASYVFILLSVGLFVLIISGVNFVNLSVIKGLDRGKEVGLRKTIGATKIQVTTQFLGESLITILLSALLGLAALVAVAPFFRNFSELDLPLNPLSNPELLIPVVVLVLVLQLICGVYPAIVLSRFKPAQVLKSGAKGGLRGGRLGLLRKGLIILQFSISMVLIVSSVLIYQQLDYIQHRNLGFQDDQVILVRLNSELRSKFQVFRDRLEQLNGVQAVATSSHVPGYRIMRENAIEVGRPQLDADLISRLILADAQFTQAYGMEFAQGRNFKELMPEGVTEYLVNEAAVPYLFGERDPLLRSLVWRGDTGKVVGVIKDFNFQSLHIDVEPLVVSSNTRLSFASIRFNPANTESVTAGIEAITRELLPELPSVEYEFLSDRFATLYKAETKLKSLVWIFCVISIVLTLSGIFGLANYIARQKTREIAIRKVLGSSVSHLVQLMSRSFLWLVSIALFIGLPVAWYLSDWWLQGFAFRVDVGAGAFVLSVLGTFLLVMLSSGYVAMKAIRANPTEALKTD